MHQAKLGIVAAALTGAIIIVLGVFQRDDDDTGEVEDRGVNVAAARGRASVGGAVGPGWAAFGAAAAPGWSTAAMTRAVSAPRRGDPAVTRRSDPGRARRLADAELSAEVRDPGADSWRLGGVKPEAPVIGEEYKVAPEGERTELTSGRHIGRLHVRVPDDPRIDMAVVGRGGAPVRAEVCVGKDGKPTEVRVVDGTGVAAVDEHVARQLLAGRYRPLRRDGRRVEFCERATVIVTRS